MPDSQQAWQLLREADLIFSAEEVQASIARVGQQISDRLADTYPLVLAVMGGGIFFAGHLQSRLRFPLDFDYIHASRYGAATAGGSIDWRVAPPAAVRGRTVLVLDDILDAGETMCAVRERILGEGAQQFFCAVLANKMLGRRKPIAADFVALQVPDRFVFGCGMDARGFWRNLPEIYALKEG